ncbi:uncharacterized protein PAC_17830 [Phialocephala subalpina]|uniref:Uncharacterized protein n=1 Tax=Phialocephala subalpina TaxID=576137 RepID=A0A1L7XSA2_9HELO|nr:uncharacterized protein PAC_17830 [Phialocephala subalpina]
MRSVDSAFLWQQRFEGLARLGALGSTLGAQQNTSLGAGRDTDFAARCSPRKWQVSSSCTTDDDGDASGGMDGTLELDTGMWQGMNVESGWDDEVNNLGTTCEDAATGLTDFFEWPNFSTHSLPPVENHNPELDLWRDSVFGGHLSHAKSNQRGQKNLEVAGPAIPSSHPNMDPSVAVDAIFENGMDSEGSLFPALSMYDHQYLAMEQMPQMYVLLCSPKTFTDIDRGISSSPQFIDNHQSVHLSTHSRSLKRKGLSTTSTSPFSNELGSQPRSTIGSQPMTSMGGGNHPVGNHGRARRIFNVSHGKLSMQSSELSTHLQQTRGPQSSPKDPSRARGSFLHRARLFTITNWEGLREKRSFASTLERSTWYLGSNGSLGLKRFRGGAVG